MLRRFKDLGKWSLRRIGNSSLNCGRLKRATRTIDRLNLGCGDDLAHDLVPGWLNIGLFSDWDIPYGTIRQINGTAVLHFDLTHGIPVQNGMVRYVYASHFIEHLTLAQAVDCLRECYRVMIGGGLIRVTCPDLELWISKYYQNDAAFFRRFYEIFQSFPDLETKGEILVGQIQGWGHRWLYDFESLAHVLSKAGFTHIVHSRLHETTMPDIERLEGCDEGKCLETLYVEAVKL